ncbi:hypothetical protein [Flavicella sediminum]|uniref:hypothetical protein n=1 Tax=Flavicella sediminum TaxID=2585141 RepID=UPI001123EC28|nr:hypothetical protein [Flavicella sediminum]
MKILKFATFLLLITVLSCSKSSDKIEITPVKDGETFVFNGGATFKYEVNLISTDTIPFQEESIEAELNGEKIQINKVDDVTWGYAIANVTASSSVVDLTFKIGQDTYIINHVINEIVLDDTPEEISNTYFDKVEVAKSEITEASTVAEVSKLSDIFDDIWSKATEQEKKEFAEFYTVNKEMFANLINPSSAENKSKESVVYLQNKTSISESNKLALLFAGSVFTLGTSIQAGVRSVANPLAAAAFVVAAVISFKVAVRAWNAYSTLQLELIEAHFENSQNKSKTASKTNADNIQNEGQNKSYGIHLTLSNISENSEIPIMAKVWSNYKSLQGITEKINSVIAFVNDYNPFSDIPSLDYPSAPPVLKDTRPITEEEYNALTISNNSSKLKQTASYSGGGISLKFDKKKGEDYSDLQKVSVGVSVALNSEFGNVNASMSVDVLLKDCNDDFGGDAFMSECDICVEGKTGKTEEEACKENPLFGSWQAISYNGKSMGTLTEELYNEECDVYLNTHALNSSLMTISEEDFSVTENRTVYNVTYSSDGETNEVDCESIVKTPETSNYSVNLKLKDFTQEGSSNVYKNVTTYSDGQVSTLEIVLLSDTSLRFTNYHKDTDGITRNAYSLLYSKK